VNLRKRIFPTAAAAFEYSRGYSTVRGRLSLIGIERKRARMVARIEHDLSRGRARHVTRQLSRERQRKRRKMRPPRSEDSLAGVARRSPSTFLEIEGSAIADWR